jgi:hypothetical protein
MAINFPDSPNNGDTHTAGGKTFTYDSTVGGWTPAAADTSGVTVYATVDDLPATGTAGDQAFVTASNRLYLWTGTGWYNIALINNNPTISGVNATYNLAIDGTATTVTITATDPEGIPITYSIASDTSGNVATITQNANVFTITPSTNSADAGTFSLTFRASDGVNIASAVSEFTLVFAVQNSNYTTALITSVGANNAVNNSFVDSSTNSHTITVAGNATQTTFSPYRHGGYSTYFDGSGDYLQLSASNDWGFGTGAWTVEFWIKSTDTDADVIAAFNSSSPYAGWSIRIENGLVKVFVSDGSSLEDFSTVSGTTIVNDNVWHHVVVTSAASYNTVSCYVDGVLAGSNAFSIAISSTGQILRVGADTNSSPSRPLAGYLTDVRIVKGTQVYTSAFTPPTERLTAITNTSLLTCHLPYIADGSTNGHAITVNGNTKTEPFSPYDYQTYSATDNGGSIYFDGSSRVEAPDSADWDQDTDSTMEAWFYPISLPSNYVHMFGQWQSGGGGNRNTQLTLDPNGRVFMTVNRSGTNYSTPLGTTLKINNWYHVAVTLNGTTLTVWVNGKNDGSTTVGGSANNSAMGWAIGGEPGSGSYPFTGLIADTRVVKGSAIYTANFTPPTAPLTAITNTKLLLNGTNAGIIDKSQAAKSITLNGDVKSSTTQSKYLSSSMYFDGTGDYVQTNTSDLYNLGTDQFTAECWMNVSDDTQHALFYFMNGGSDVLGVFYYHTNNSLGVVGSGAWITGNVGSGSNHNVLNPNQWHHVAISRDATTFRAFVDGTQVYSGSNSGNFGSNLIRIASHQYSADLYGYISDFRFTKGLAHYTANFTPPTAALQG